MDGTYQPGEPHQETILVIRSKVKHSPGTQPHMFQILKAYFKPKGVPEPFMEGDRIILEL